ncbi:Monoamine oxidase [Ruegeria halocynthiae]|uniref:Tryptophan 2-monooxygenase n=2 Tax=Ruegeria halocynthiae TaxID=985054 RepID=A0A1H2YGL4_9RHOB|nr:Monoamine oxidase [Ruegeria halocynthiae]
MITRRNVLLTGAAALSTPMFVRRAHAADVDVVVIGAGAAGISTARELMKRGLTVTVIEADSRIGGRIHTDTEVFGVPYDVGAHWLHNREENPFVDYGLKHGFDMYEAPDEAVFYVGDRPANSDESKAYEAAEQKALDAIVNAARKGKDVAPADVVPDLGDWALSVNIYQGAYEMAKDFDHFSCSDWYTAEDGTDWYCREGFGTLFAHSARDVPVTLETAASEVRWGGSGVEVVTDNGTINARAVVVTVSMGVLAGGDIKFDPPLPVKKQEAINVLTMGHYNHVALQLKDNFFGVGSDGYYNYKITEEMNGAPMGFGALVDANGHGITYCDLGGEFARQMSDEGTGAMYDFVVSELKKAFGSKVEDAILNSSTFDWTTNPYTYGSFASAEPGGAWSRDELRSQEADRLWFAGEALSDDDWATVAGAHKSGLVVAEDIHDTL